MFCDQCYFSGTHFPLSEIAKIMRVFTISEAQWNDFVLSDSDKVKIRANIQLIFHVLVLHILTEARF